MLRQAWVEQRKSVSLPDVIAQTTDLLFNLSTIVTCPDDSGYQTRLFLQGVDRHGFSVQILVTDFRPTFLMRCETPSSASDDDALADAVDLLDGIQNEVAQERQERFNNKSKVVFYENCEVVYRYPFVGFTNRRQDRLIKVTCSHIRQFQSIVKQLKLRKVVLYHDDFDVANQFLQDRGLAYREWVKLKQPTKVHRSELCNINACTLTENVTALSEEENKRLGPPITLRAFLRFKAVSRDGVVENRKAYAPDSTQPFDRLLVMAAAYNWCDKPDEVKEYVFSLIPHPQLLHCPDEASLLSQFQANIRDTDPDHLFYFDDELEHLPYWCNRVVGQRKAHPDLPRFPHLERQPTLNPEAKSYLLQTRSLFNLEAILKQKVFISVETYDLYTIALHDKFSRQSKEIIKLLAKNKPLSPAQQGIWDRLHAGPPNVNEWMRSTPPAALGQRMSDLLHFELDLMVQLDMDNNLELEYASIAWASNTRISDTVLRGQQIRIMNKLAACCVQKGAYVNRKMLNERKPLRFNAAQHPPTFMDPPELALNRDLREEAKRQFEHKVQKQIFAPSLAQLFAKHKDDDEDGEEGEDDGDDLISNVKKVEKEIEGGSVLKPVPRFWGSEVVCIYDFSSLYPSIMIARNLSYENFVFDPEYLNLPGVKYVYALVNKHETVCIAQQTGGILPDMVAGFLKQRKLLKRLMEETTDDFMKKNYDSRQLSVKTLANATYGFTGADMCQMKEMMLTVCSFGRHLQKTCANYVGETYRLPVVYGDTDSIMPWFNVREDLAPYQEDMTKVAHYFKERFAMTETLREMVTAERKELADQDWSFTWENVCRYYQEVARVPKGKLPVDVLNLSFDHRLHCLIQLASIKITQECTAMLGHPQLSIVAESLVTGMWMNNNKKYYSAQLYEEHNPTLKDKIKVTGLPGKKREYAPFCRYVLSTVMDMIVNGQTHKIAAFLEHELFRLVRHEVPKRELVITKRFDSMEHYKNLRSAHLQLVEKEEKRTRSKMRPRRRIRMVFLKGPEKIYLRAENPDYVQDVKEIDVSFYLLNQILPSLHKLLQHHTQLFDFPGLCTRLRAHLFQEQHNLGSLHELEQNITTKRPLTLADLKAKAKRRKQEALPSSGKRTGERSTPAVPNKKVKR